MYAYTHDPETGGLLLLDSPALISKEPRPVWSRELDLLGFDRFWKYEKRDDVPYLWAEMNFYWYRGQRVAKTVGGSLFEKPELVLEQDESGKPLLPLGSILMPVDIDAMIKKNEDILKSLEKKTVQRIFDIYSRHKKKMDSFHVAFSGGKDSTVLLEVVRRALPEEKFFVIFGDTGMEFPDTYDIISQVEAECKKKTWLSIVPSRISALNKAGNSSVHRHVPCAGVVACIKRHRKH